MVNKKQFSQIAKRIVKSNKGLQSPRIMHPIREWFIGITLAVIVFVACGAWSAYIHMKHKDLSVKQLNEIDSEVVVYKESLVGTAIKEFSERLDKHDVLLQEISANPIIEDVPEEVEDTTVATASSSEVITDEELPVVVSNEVEEDAVTPEEAETDGEVLEESMLIE
ncbi:hypothetical protein KC865_03375 [Candidatus Kaiserbacteria bacterium]|nr:hypothetical protein [Candidatus Kaiserbacteria bacterium]USN92605.1 MAG: hypothetical protein H6782_02205 [Candidatus Nomurabacteria bacterium]